MTAKIHHDGSQNVAGGLGNAAPCGGGPVVLLAKEDPIERPLSLVGDVVVEGCQADESTWEV